MGLGTGNRSHRKLSSSNGSREDRLYGSDRKQPLIIFSPGSSPRLVALDPIKQPPLRSTTCNVRIRESSVSGRLLNSSYFTDSYTFDCSPYCLPESYEAREENEPPRRRSSGSAFTPQARCKASRRYSKPRCLLDESIEELSTPTLTPDISPRQQPVKTEILAALDGEDSIKGTEPPSEFVGERVSGAESQCYVHPRVPKLHRLGTRLRSSQLCKGESKTVETPTKQKSRFITPRQDQSAVREAFVMSKPPSSLQGLEKALRRRTNRSDLFGPEPHAASQSRASSPNRCQRRTFRPTRVDDVREVVNTSALFGRSNRAISNVPAQDVGRTSLWNFQQIPVHTDRSDLRPSIPVYASRFHVNSSPRNEFDIYTRRLALACDFDPANRVFNPSPSMYDVQSQRQFLPFKASHISPGSPM